jgi:hypothetical protein
MVFDLVNANIIDFFRLKLAYILAVYQFNVTREFNLIGFT